MLQIRIIDDLDTTYPILLSWWQAHGWENGVPRAILPKLGVMAEHKGEPTAAAWLYMDNSIGVSMLEWIVSNPTTSPRIVALSLKHIIAFLKEQAKELHYNIMLTTCRHTSLSTLLQKNGFLVTDSQMIHHIAAL